MDYKLYNNDCLDKLKELEDNSVDSIITDPPYGLNFMNKKWDYSIPSVEIWKECLRVLKPGGYLLSFAGTRTQHRMACNIEDAGFEIKDMIAWVYACYSEDTECLTNNGWKKYNEILGDDMILQWDHESNNLSWYKPKEILAYDAPDEMVHFENRHTDQLLTKNHRCYINYKKHQRNKFNEGYTVVEAGDIKKHWIKNFPLAGNLDQGSTVNNPYLLGWWMTDAWVHGGGKACMFSQVKPKTLAKLRDALSLADCKFSEYIKERRCFNELHGDEHSFYVTGNLAEQFLSSYPIRKFSYEIMAWDFNSRQLFLEGLLDGDGSRPMDQHSETFWSLDHERLDVVQALCLSLNIRSYVDYKKGCVYLNRKTNTTQLQCKHTNKVESYSGKVVWCLQTETGAFVVRRNGKAFISGNSGMPKHRSCLKPALEPITLARKPAKKATLLNIEECRVERIQGDRTDYGLKNAVRSQGNCFGAPTSSADFDSTKGRYPSNVILSYDEDEYQLVDSVTEEQLEELNRWFYENS